MRDFWRTPINRQIFLNVAWGAGFEFGNQTEKGEAAGGFRDALAILLKSRDRFDLSLTKNVFRAFENGQKEKQQIT